ncbi:MAG TPA: TraR/DksA C4-type zinc finger protein [Syntrophorhabdaceae bacterium]|nr:TraR/DksA C4-type zinc finger protein [Syntrophorhabdaceae bacterium]
MKRSEQLEQIEKQLVERKNRVFQAHRKAEEGRKELMEPDSEFEETAQKESMEDVLAALDEREKEEIEAIDLALSRIELGEYGLCEICGRRISIGRLKAIPWTSLCSQHARTWSNPAATVGAGRFKATIPSVEKRAPR